MGLLDKFVNFCGTLTRAGTKVEQALDYVNRRQLVEVEIKSALQSVNYSYNLEIKCLRAAVKQTELDLEIEEYKNQSAQHRILFEKNQEKFRIILGEIKQNKQTMLKIENQISDIPLTDLIMPMKYEKLSTNEEVKKIILEGIIRKYNEIVQEYDSFLSDLIENFKRRPQFREIFFLRLNEFGGAGIARRVENFELGIEWKLRNTLALRLAARRKGLANLSEAPFDCGEVRSNLSTTRIAEERSIPFLVHFTRTKNLESIFRHGLCSVQTLATSNIVATTNDRLRLDGYPNGISVSIAFPNYKMFYKYRQDEPDEMWAVLLIDPAVLWKRSCVFCQHNAADHRIREQPLSKLRSAESFRGMFEDVNGLPSRASQRLFDYDPTDPQAEVLVFESIDPAQIVGVAFNDPRVARAYSHLKQNRKWDVCQKGRGLFSSREVARQVRS